MPVPVVGGRDDPCCIRPGRGTVCLAMTERIATLVASLGACACLMVQAFGQPAEPPRPPGAEGQEGPPPFGLPGEGPGFRGGPRGPGGPGFPGGPGGPGQAERKLVKQFDKDGDKRLDAVERKAARAWLAEQGNQEGGRGRGPRGPGGAGENAGPAAPGPRLSPADVKAYGDAPFYAPDVLRTVFIQFENADWEKELSDFYNTDVEVPAQVTVDGKVYRDVGIHFRGASSYFTVGEGRKRSLNLSVDYAHKEQRIGGYRTLNLLNSHTDPTYLRTVLYAHIGSQYLPVPKANHVRVVINGESWGVFVNAQQFNSDFIQEHYGTTRGSRWKVPGSPRGNGGLAFVGEDVEAYRRLYEIKSKDDPKAWGSLIRLCRVLSETPTAELEAALEPILDVDGTLRFLALENVLINNDGYWIRASDYNLYLDEKGRFHLVPHDANETFRSPDGPGWRGGGGGGGGLELDPFAGGTDSNKPLLSRLLAVPSLRVRYLGYVRHMAENWLDWRRLEPVARQYQALIAEDVRSDTRRLYPVESFEKGLTEDVASPGGFRGPRMALSLKSFADQRRAFLLKYTSDNPVTPPKM